MKISYKHLIKKIKSKPSIDELSSKLFQLGHEHEIENDIFDMEFTPNRGDCLSINGLLRDLQLFYDINDSNEFYKEDINPLSINFSNKAENDCPHITFLKLDVKQVTSNYVGELNDYFVDLGNNKNNFFTDISNYVSYETGQPTHCYDYEKIGKEFSLEFNYENDSFKTLLGKNIQLQNKNLVFKKGNEIINLAGVIGGSSTACSVDTKSVLIECAYFNPEIIIGKSVRYDIQSDAAHKFERGVDPSCQNKVLRRFISIVKQHAEILSIELKAFDFKDLKPTIIENDFNKVQKIIGSNFLYKDYEQYLSRLGFQVNEKIITVPFHRNDIQTKNDIAEEIARSLGYDNIPINKIKLDFHNKILKKEVTRKIKKMLLINGFYEVINNPFVSVSNENSIQVDNPLDSNRKYLRTNLLNSLLENLLYNERRQKDSIKMFEISDIYSKSNPSAYKRVIGIIASGRVANNYEQFSKKIDDEYLKTIFKKYIPEFNPIFIDIDRRKINSKIKNHISYLEFELEQDMNINIDPDDDINDISTNFKKYVPISDYPSSSNDLSFSVKDYSKAKDLENLILNYKNELLKEVFLFDYYKNDNAKLIKMGFRFIFQSKNSTITDKEVKLVMSDIINLSLKIDSIEIPGLIKQ